MGKVKINLASGSSIEKPIITCFKGTNGDYLVLDNETNGSMGLPIICISKFNGSTVEKIFDQSEWASVKENLKTIIAGTALPYLNVPESLSAQDDFFTQLTLPVASFDLLKSVYAPVAPQTEAIVTPEPVAPIENVAPTEPAQISPVDIMAPTALSTLTPPSVPSTDVPNATPAESITPMISTPTTDPVVQPNSVIPPVVSSAPIPSAQNPNDIQTIKDTFMKSCENMFDALLKKFENK